MAETSYKIYSASAGSGKTTTLVASYLAILLSAPGKKKFSQILAITFTNKAVNEMKGRILEYLALFGQDPPPETHPVFSMLSEELGLNASEMSSNARKILWEILHNYAFFDISTIDKFTHRVIRTFARDLRIPQNFEVVLDTPTLLEEAVARLIYKAGDQADLTQLLIRFALSKAEVDKSWDISYDLLKIGSLIFSENHLYHLKQIEGKNLSDFDSLEKSLLKKQQTAEVRIKSAGKDILGLMESAGLEATDFNRGYFPAFAKQAVDFRNPLDFSAKWKQNFGSEPLYTKSCPGDKAGTIDSLMPAFTAAFDEIRSTFFNWAMLQNARSQLTPLAVLNSLQQEVSLLLRERDQLAISDFNSLIAREIKDQPAPFIYERLGEKYRHYFIDEFQDTSRLQWQNLVPLIANSLEGQNLQGETGSLLLVGDAKQAIYRWRGGRVEQFLELMDETNDTFTVSPLVNHRPVNYRSHKEIIDFNNRFFTQAAATFSNTGFGKLYQEGNRQQFNQKEGGYVSLHFIDPALGGKDELYSALSLRILDDIIERGYNYSDTCILTRSRREGVALAEALIGNGIPVISSETLLLCNNPEVMFLISILYFANDNSDLDHSFQILLYLSDGLPDLHSMLESNLRQPSEFLQEEYGFRLSYLRTNSAYDSLSYAIRCFGLGGKADAYLTYLLDEALAIEHKENGSIATFLEHWEQKRESLSIVSPENMNAVSIMTIHKAKGLEFPVVIYPYANADMHNKRNSSSDLIWLPVDAGEYAGFPELLLQKKKDICNYNELARTLYEQEQEQLELDAMNVLYVALTRAEQELYILSELDLDKDGNPKPMCYSGLFISFLQAEGVWSDSRDNYSFGNPMRHDSHGAVGQGSTLELPYSYKDMPVFEVVTTAGKLWGSTRETAILKGNQIHRLMEMIKSDKDIEPALDKLERTGEISEGEAKLLHQLALEIVSHPSLSRWYSDGADVRNETELIDENGLFLRPDRLVFEKGKVTVIDYKTGSENPAYRQQLLAYSKVLQDIGYEIEALILVYINNMTVKTDFI